MKIQLEQIDLLQPWPQIALAPGYHSVRVLAYVGNAPLGEVIARPARKGIVSHRNLRKRLAKKHALTLLRMLAREGLGAGPEALASFPPEAKSSFLLTWSKWRQTTQWVEENLLLPTGLPAPYRDWVTKGQADASYPLPPVTVVTYTRVPAKGLSRARNVALQLAGTRWVAFTDDDCRPEPNWLRELVRPLQDTNCASVTGLVLPATMDNAAEITFEVYGGLGRGYQDKTWDGWAISKSRYRPVETWRMGAGANMLIDAPRALELGGYDLDLGAGAAAPCSEDTDVWYQLLRCWHTIHYTPRAIVNHHHRSSPEELRKQIYAYAKGHAAYHWRCFWVYRDYRSLLHLLFHLPRWFRKNLRMGMAGKTKYPFSLVFLEVKGTIAGPIVYTMAKARRLGRTIVERLRHPVRPPTMGPVAADPIPTPANYDNVDARKQSVRVA